MSLFWVCPNCGSQIYVWKLACPRGHVFCGSKPLSTRDASRKVMLVQQALETEEQTTKHRKSNKECVVETCTYMVNTVQYVCTCMVNTATICMYRHGQYCYNMYRNGTYPGLPGSVPQIPYSLHMLTTIGRDLLGQDKGIVGQLGALLSCTTLCSLS